jgi:FkbM family methyltransferase
MTLLEELSLPILRAPGPWIPGWFPLVAERAHRALSVVEGEREIELLGSKMVVDTSEYTQRRYFYHCYEAPELHFLRRVLRPGDVVADVGAHVGIVVLVAARHVGRTGAVHAFEPVPANLERLRRNIALNGFEQVLVNAVAVGASAGEVRVGLSDVAAQSRSTGGFTVGGAHDAVEVRRVALDDYFEAAGTPPRVVKLDVEGSELSVLDGFQRTLERAPPDLLLVEVNQTVLAAQGSSTSGLAERLGDLGYRLMRPTVSGRLRPLPPLERLREAAAHPRPRSPLRAGLAERNAFFNAVAVLDR